MNVELVEYTPNGEMLIERAMRICHGGDCDGDKPNKKFIQGVIKLGHGSVLEHASATFKISGVSRSLTHQLVRHRLSSYTQLSQRYVKEDQFDYVIPPAITNSGLTDDYMQLMQSIQSFYNKAIEKHVLREDARYVLPNACMTSIWMTSNLRQWRSVIELRSDHHAQWEIRDLSNTILRKLYKIYPIIFEDLYIKYILSE